MPEPEFADVHVIPPDALLLHVPAAECICGPVHGSTERTQDEWQHRVLGPVD